MIHRYQINRRRLLGPNRSIVSAATTTWISGETLNNIQNKSVTNSIEFDQEIYNKNIVIPIELKFEPMDYSDIIDKWVDDETQRAINKIEDGEKVKYTSYIPNLEIEFRFLDRNTNQYSNLYNSNGFNTPYDFKLNRFKKSYFRLYFYDSNTGETANLLFTEDIDVIDNDAAVFPLKRLYWDRDDSLMFNSFTNRTIYMEGRFFNANTGQIQTLYNLPTSFTSPIGIDTYSDTNNRGWRTSPIQLINPNNVNGDHRFMPVQGVGGTTAIKITLSEFILT